MIREFHEVANIFPMMQGDEFDALKADIDANGLREPVWLHPDGRIIDGRNRYLACCELGIEPQYRTWNCTGSLVAFVVSLNLHRRHLSSSQKAVVALDILPMLETEAKERQRDAAKQTNAARYGSVMTEFIAASPIVADNVRRAEERKELLSVSRYMYFIRSGDQVKIGISIDPDKRLEQVRTSNPNAVMMNYIPVVNGIESQVHKELEQWNVGGEWYAWCDDVEWKINSLIAFSKSEKSDRTPFHAAKEAARIAGVSTGYIAEAKRLAAEAPEWVEKIRSGDATITEAKRAIKEDRREQRRQENAEKVAAAPDPLEVGARFATILIDPPWDWGDEGDVNQMGRAKPDYSTMSIDELLALPVGELADVDCHIYLWITNRSLPKGFALLERWGFRYVTCLTWAKPHFGMGNYFRGQTEHILFGVKGSQPLRRHDVGTVFYADRGPNGHSSKPTEIYELIESCSPGPYLEMFSRCNRDGWASWGEGNGGV